MFSNALPKTFCRQLIFRYLYYYTYYLLPDTYYLIPNTYFCITYYLVHHILHPHHLPQSH